MLICAWLNVCACMTMTVFLCVLPRVSLTQSSSTLMSMLFSLLLTPILSQNSLMAAAGYPADRSVDKRIDRPVNQPTQHEKWREMRKIAAQFEGIINQSLLLVEREIRSDNKYQPSGGRRNGQFYSTLPMRLHHHQCQMRSSVTSSSDTAYGGHAWVVPPTDMLVSH